MEAFYVWKKLGQRSPITATMDMDTLRDAIQFGSSTQALYFTLDDDPARHFTNAWEVVTAADVMEYIENKGPSGFKPGELSLMFQRTVEKDSPYKQIASIPEAMKTLKKEKEDTHFVRLMQGGLVKLQEGDIAYDKNGLQSWPKVSSDIRPKGRFRL